MATLFDTFGNQNCRCFACGSLVYAVEKKLTTNHVSKDENESEYFSIHCRFTIIDVFVVEFVNEISRNIHSTKKVMISIVEVNK